MDYALFLPLAAFTLDLALGDPHSWPHPVRLIGWALDRLEALIQSAPSSAEGDRGESFPPAGAGRSPAFKRLYGLLVAILLSLAVLTIVFLLTRIPVLGGLFALYLSFVGLALGQLLREARAVARLIESRQIEEARRQLSFLVSRDTSVLVEPDLWRTLAETVSENFCDAFVAPFFYLCLGGPPLLWFYKTVSTMDSMWGYKTARFRDLGWAGARGDDLLAYVPARLAAYLMIAAGFALGLPARRALSSLGQDARKMASPNAGWPMSAAAWLCGASMGGQAVYFGCSVDKPLIGPNHIKWDITRFRKLVLLIILSAFGMVSLAQVLLWGYLRIFS